MKKLSSILLLLTLVFTLAACGSDEDTNTKETTETTNTEKTKTNESNNQEIIKLKVGASPAPHAQILEFAKELLLEKNVELEIIEFTDYVIPNLALDEKELDANFFQHEPYQEFFNEKYNTSIVTAAKVHFEPLGIYPGKSTDFNNIPEGAEIAVPYDTTNEARALQLLALYDVITLKEGVGLEATPLDIIDNPKNIKIIELEAAIIANSLPDVDFAIINGNYALSAGIVSQVLVSENENSEATLTFPNILSVNSGDEETEGIKILVEVLNSEEVRTFINEEYGAAVIPSF